LTWNKIAEKCDVHKCEEACSHVTTTDNQSIFWLPAFFNNNNKMNSWPKRQGLPFLQVYLRTSTKALQAFLLLYPGLKWAKEDNASYRLVSLSFKKIRLADGPDGYIMTASVSFPKYEGAKKRKMANFSALKGKMDKILEGYPPWYQNKIELLTNQGSLFQISHPIQNRKDITRGGWIISIGFRYVEPIAHHLMRYTLDNEGYRSYTDVNAAFKRMEHCAREISKEMELKFPMEGQYKLYKALEIWLHDSQIYLARRDNMDSRDSQIPEVLTRAFAVAEMPNNRWFDPTTNSSPSGPLSKEQYRLAIKTFSQYRPLEGANIEELKLITPVVVRSDMKGSYAVMKYMADYVLYEKHKFVEFHELENEKDEIVYLTNDELQE